MSSPHRARASLSTSLAFVLAAFASAQDAPTDKKDATPSDFARFVPVGDGGHFDTAITTYRDAQGRTVRLFAAVHIADGAHYAALQQRFAACDALLYELVGPDDYKPVKGEGGTGSFVSLIQTGLKNGLELEFQLDAVDYTAPNFVHADMTADEFRESMQERGESLFGLILKMSMQSAKGGADGKPAGAEAFSFDLVKAFRSGEGRHRLRVALASQLEQLESMAAGGEDEKGSTLLEGRNEKCLQVLDRELKAGKKDLGIYYGAAHLTHMEQRLLQMGFQKVDHEWLQAWDCTKRPDPKFDRELWQQRQRAKLDLTALAKAAVAWQQRTASKEAPTLVQLTQKGSDGEPAFTGRTQDPWGRDYVLRGFARTDEPAVVDVQTLGQDGVAGTDDDLHSLSARELRFREREAELKVRLQREVDAHGGGRSPATAKGSDDLGDAAERVKAAMERAFAESAKSFDAATHASAPPGPGPIGGLFDELHRMDREAKLVKAEVDVRMIEVVVKHYQLRNGRLPTMADLTTPDAKGHTLLEERQDPWAHDYVIRGTDRQQPDVRSAGPDGVFDTDDDVTSASPAAPVTRSAEGAQEPQSESKQTMARFGIAFLRFLSEQKRSEGGHWPALADLDTKLRQDPWGKDYRLQPSADGKTIEVRSAGPDGVFDNDDDIDDPDVDASTPAAAIDSGKRLHVRYCAACHSVDGSPRIGPSWQGIWGKPALVVEAGERKSVTVDEAYVRESLREPARKKVVGFEAASMTQFDAKVLDDRSVRCIVAYLRSLADADAPKDRAK